jgi:3-dehydroquinate synthetase
MQSELIYLNKAALYKELETISPDRFFAVADHKIKSHLPEWIQKSSQVFWLKNPEEEKNLSTYGSIIEFCLASGIDRSSTLIAIGGGATTDLGGFVAATILRGIQWIAIPTTLLAMIDGSLGGKVAVNTPSGKNLAGAFHHPQKIYISGEFLQTLDEENWNSGKGEMLKYGFLSHEIYSLIVNKTPVEKIALSCAEFKMEVVKRDFREQGERIHLNLGHTLGHAFEFSLGIPHGLAVAMGMKYLFEILGNNEALKYWQEMVKALSLPEQSLSLKAYSFKREELDRYLEKDKKKSHDNLRLVLTAGPGKVSVSEITMKDFKARMDAHAEFARK